MNRLLQLLVLTLLATTATAQVTTSARFGFRSANDPAYGATCVTGAGTTDSGDAIEAALNAASAAGGGTVYLPACAASGGFYRINNSIAIPSNTTLRCERGAVLKQPDGAAPTYDGSDSRTGLIGFYGVSNAGIEGCTLDGSGVSTPSNQANPIEIGPATPWTGTRADGITVRGNTIISQSHANGPYMSWCRLANNVKVIDNTYDGLQTTFAASTDQQGIEIIACNNVEVRGNDLRNIGRYGILVGAFTSGSFPNYHSSNIKITGNTVRVAKAGINIEAAMDADGTPNLAYQENISVSGNIITDAWEVGIRTGFGNAAALTADAAIFRNISIVGNVVNNSVLTQNPYGIGFIWGDANATAGGFTVSGNVFVGGKGDSATAPSGMLINSVRGVLIEGNVWSGGDVSTSAPLVYLASDSHDVKFVGNTFGPSGGHAFSVGTAAADRFTFVGNHFNGYGSSQAASQAIHTGIGTKNKWTVVGNTFTRSTGASEGYVMNGTISSNVGWVWRDNIVGHTMGVNYQAAGLWVGTCTTTFTTVNANSHGCQRMATGTSSIQVANAQARSGSRVYVTQTSGQAIPVKVTPANGSFTIEAGFKDDGTTQFTCSADCNFRWEIFN